MDCKYVTESCWGKDLMIMIMNDELERAFVSEFRCSRRSSGIFIKQPKDMELRVEKAEESRGYDMSPQPQDYCASDRTMAPSSHIPSDILARVDHSPQTSRLFFLAKTLPWTN